MKLTFLCLVASVAVMMAAFGCNHRKSSLATENVDPPHYTSGTTDDSGSGKDVAAENDFNGGGAGSNGKDDPQFANEQGILTRIADKKACGAYFLREPGTTDQIYFSPVFVTRASCIVMGQNGKKFEYYPAKDFTLWMRGHATYGGAFILEDSSKFLAHADFKFGQKGFKNDIALVPLSSRYWIKYSEEPDYVKDNADWLSYAPYKFFSNS